jgi:hypothetical protein
MPELTIVISKTNYLFKQQPLWQKVDMHYWLLIPQQLYIELILWVEENYQSDKII